LSHPTHFKYFVPMPKKGQKKADTVYDAVDQKDFKRLVELIKAGADVNESEEDTALSKAAELGRADMVRELLTAGADPNFGGIWVPLCSAVRGKNPEGVELLIGAKAEVDAQEEDGSTALMLAACVGNLEMVKMLVAAGADPKLGDEESETAIISGRKWPEIVDFLKPLSSPEDIAYLEKEQKGTPVDAEEFLKVAKTCEIPEIQKLLTRGAPVDVADKSDETALHYAAEAGNKELVQLLLQAGAAVDAKNNCKRTPLALAAGRGHGEVAKILIAAGADLESKDGEGATPFLSSVGRQREDRDMMRLLAQAGAKLDVVDAYGRSALDLASRYLPRENDEFADDEKKADGQALRETFIEIGLLHPQANQLTAEASAGNVEAVRARIESGVPIDAYDEQERTALYMAVARRHPALVDYLLKAGADVHKCIGHDDDRDRNAGGPMFISWGNGLNPLMISARDGTVEIAGKLLNAGADPNRGKESITPLMAACYCGHLEMAKLLVGRGAEVAREGKTPDRLREKVTALSIAANGKFRELTKWLMDNGVPVKDRKQVMLVEAARHGNVSEINKLLADGAKAEQPDPLTRELPLEAAANECHGEAVAVLLKAGAPVAAPKQMSPLLQVVGAMETRARANQLDPATTERYLDIIRQLLAAGCKPEARYFGFDPLSVARSIKCQPLVELLEAAIPPKSPAKKKK
jgi:ankyrin repeat protein